ncbi:amino acid/polyamine transporter I, partial [Thamnocephalis sphaerospora]
KPSIGFVAGVSMLVSGMLNAESFAMPGIVWRLMEAPGAMLAMWAVGGVCAFCGSLSYAELGTMLPHSGAEQVYLAHCYKRPHRLLSFLFAWSVIVTDGGGATGLDFENEWTTRGIGLCCLVTIAILNALSSRWTNRLHSVMAVVKVLVMLMIILLGFAALAGGIRVQNPGNWRQPFAQSAPSLYAYAQAFISVNWTLGGWNWLNYSVNEMKRPERTLPITVISSLGLVTLLVLLVSVVYTLVIPAEVAFAANQIIAAAFGVIIFGQRVGQVLMPAIIALVAYGTASVYIYALSRSTHVAACRKYLPYSHLLSRVDRSSNAPRNAIVFNTCCVALFLVAPPPGSAFRFLVSLASFPSYIFYTIVLAGLILLRYTEPATARPFRVWVPLTVIALLSGLAVCASLLVPPSAYDERHGTATDVPFYLAPLVGFVVACCGTPLW